MTGSLTFVNSQNYLTDVGAYTSTYSQYGTFDQGGNVSEWFESPISGSNRGFRGGNWNNFSSALQSSARGFLDPTTPDQTLGFRIAGLFAPQDGGDYSGDGTVDAADYVIWRKIGINGPQGYIDWRNNFGTSLGMGSGSGSAGDSPSQAAVPEPATPVLLMFAVAGWCLRLGRNA